jgi:hypothetical protein
MARWHFQALVEVAIVVCLAGANPCVYAASAGSDDAVDIIFDDGFENTNRILDLFPRDASRWSRIEQSHKENKLELQSQIVNSGERSLCLKATGTNGKTSKMSIISDGVDFREGQRVVLSAWFYLPSGQDVENMTLFDLECTTCWPENSTKQNMSPGIRVRLEKSEGNVTVSRSKIGQRSDLRAPQSKRVPFPRDRWTHFKWIVDLSTSDAGNTEIYLDDVLVLSGRGVNMPNVSVFKQYGIELKQPVKYDQFEVGISANSRKTPIVMCVDDVEVQASKRPN